MRLLPPDDVQHERQTMLIGEAKAPLQEAPLPVQIVRRVVQPDLADGGHPAPVTSARLAGNQST
jgi:hypothetical protein